MDDLGKAFDEILAQRDCPVVRQLLADCREIAAKKGDAEGLAHAAMLLTAVREWAGRERVYAAHRKPELSGPVLGDSEPPTEGEWWGLLSDGDIVPANHKRAGESLYWCVGSDGWNRIPERWREGRMKPKARGTP